MESLGLSPDAAMAALITFASLCAVFVPLFRGMRIVYAGRAATRKVERAELKKAVGDSGKDGRVPSLAVLMARTLVRSLRENSERYPREFVFDATKQYVINEFDANYARRISMYANLLPPIGFIGTTGGLLILFLSMHLADASLELGALAVALTSSIFALMGFALLEAMKIRLYSRLLVCLDEVMALQGSGAPGRESAAA